MKNPERTEYYLPRTAPYLCITPLGKMPGLTDFEIQILVRHKSAGIMEWYSHGRQVVDFMGAGKKLEMSIAVNRTRKIANE
jgi:hypothetical protein